MRGLQKCPLTQGLTPDASLKRSVVCQLYMICTDGVGMESGEKDKGQAAVGRIQVGCTSGVYPLPQWGQIHKVNATHNTTWLLTYWCYNVTPIL